MTKIQSSKRRFKKLEFRISNLFRISIFEFRVLTQRGASLYLSLIIMTIMLAAALGLSAIFISQTKALKQMGNSVIAFCAADTGIEAVLLNRNNPSSIPETTLSNNATYQVIVTSGGAGGCPAGNNYCIKSIGSFSNTKRAIEITY